jgi:hypothetical protein
MEEFNLPYTTIVNKVIPKNSFDAYTTSKQKKLFADLVQRITWTHKLSPETTNLPGKDIKELQIFKIELKSQEKIDSILLAIDKAIPYTIIFVVIVDQQMYVSTSVKHSHPVNEDNAVIDWTFRSEWGPIDENKYNLSLKKSLDAAYLSLCVQLSDRSGMGMKSIQELVELCKLVDDLTKEVNRLKVAITGCRQFNQKVKLNVELLALENQLSFLINKGSVHTPNKI